MSSGKDSEGSGASDDDNEADDHDAERGGEDESVRRVRIPSPGAGLSSSSLGAGTAGSSSRSVVSRTSSQRSASPGAPSTTASLRRRRQPTSSPDVSDEQPHASAEGAGGGGAATRQSRPKAKKRKMRSELATHGSDTRGREGGCASSSSSDPRAGDDAAFAKALKSEVQCEICFAMLYAPVTTPCQHVSDLAGAFLTSGVVLSLLIEQPSPFPTTLVRRSAGNASRGRWTTAPSVRCAVRRSPDTPISTSTRLIGSSSPSVSFLLLGL